MKFRNRFLKYKVNFHASPDGGEGGGGNNVGNGDVNEVVENNSDSNLPSFEDLWSNNDEGETGDTPAAVTIVQQAEPKPAEEVFNEHVSNIDFTAGVDLANVQNALQNGDQEAFGKALRSIGENAYRQSMIDASKIINQRVEAAKDEMATATSTATATERAVAELNSALPYTKSPMYKPVADAVFTRFLEQKGMTVDKAIEKTGEYFTKFSGDVAKANPKAPGSRPAGGFGAINDEPAGDEDQDWMDFLGAPST